MIKFNSTGMFHLKTKGDCYTIKNPVVCDEFDWLIGATVEIDNNISGVVAGVESFAITEHSIGEDISLLLK